MDAMQEAQVQCGVVVHAKSFLGMRDEAQGKEELESCCSSSSYSYAHQHQGHARPAKQKIGYNNEHQRPTNVEIHMEGVRSASSAISSAIYSTFGLAS